MNKTLTMIVLASLAVALHWGQSTPEIMAGDENAPVIDPSAPTAAGSEQTGYARQFADPKDIVRYQAAKAKARARKRR
jgi:hypothetical protein